MRTRYAPPSMPGWGPMTTPPRPSRRGELLRELIVPGLLAGFLLWRGILLTIGGLIAFALAMWLWFTWKNSHQQGRLLLEWAAVAAVLVILSNAGITAPNIKVAADRKAPTERVDAAKGDLEKARQGLKNIAEDIQTRLPTFGQPELEPKKGHR